MEYSYTRPSKTGAFLKGLVSGAFSGALMVGIITGLSFAFGAGMMGWPAALMLTAAPAIFAGIMNVKNVMFSEPQIAFAPERRATDIAPVMVPIVAPSLAPSVSQDAAPDAPAKSWTAQVNTNPDRIAQILHDGAMSDKDRAAAILAARDAAPADAGRA